jgi:hypothetical protein
MPLMINLCFETNNNKTVFTKKRAFPQDLSLFFLLNYKVVSTLNTSCYFSFLLVEKGFSIW